MTTVQINLPDQLAQMAQKAGLLAPEAIETMLREQLRRRATETLNDVWQRLPQDELTLDLEQEIMDEVRKVRAEHKHSGSH